MYRYLLFFMLAPIIACGQTGRKAADAQQTDRQSADSTQVADRVAVPDAADIRRLPVADVGTGDGDQRVISPDAAEKDEWSPDVSPTDIAQDLPLVPEVHEDAPVSPPDAPLLPDTGTDASPGGGVFGTVTVTSGDCMPPAPPACAQAEILASGDIYFVNVDSEQSYSAWWEDDEYQVYLPDGEYYVWPDVGWNGGTVAKECWEDLTQCSQSDYAFIQGDFDYMAAQAKCASDGLWQSHNRCNVLISGTIFRVDIDIDNVAY